MKSVDKYVNYLAKRDGVDKTINQRVLIGKPTQKQIEFIDEMVKNPDVDPETLGKVIVDSYYKSVEEIGQQSGATLSLVNLNKLDDVLEALKTFTSDEVQFAEDRRDLSLLEKRVKEIEAA